MSKSRKSAVSILVSESELRPSDVVSAQVVVSAEDPAQGENGQTDQKPLADLPQGSLQGGDGRGHVWFGVVPLAGRRGRESHLGRPILASSFFAPVPFRRQSLPGKPCLLCRLCRGCRGMRLALFRLGEADKLLVDVAFPAIGKGDAPLPDAAGRSEQLVVLKERWADVLAQFRSLGFDQDGATARLDSARAALRVAEQAATPRKVSAEESSEIERLHDECLEYWDKVGGGLRRGAARKRLEGAESELDQVLESIGYTTWSQFRMGNGMVMVTDDVLRSFDAARAELDATELEWAELRTMLETDPYLVEIEGELSSVDRDAVTLLGSDPGGTNTSDRTERLLKALAGVLVDASSAVIDERDAEERLRVALKACGTTAHNGISSIRALLALGDSWLSVLRASEIGRAHV